MDSPKKRKFSIPRVYQYLFGFGLLLFGAFAMYFRTYDHPFYGRIDLGEYHRFIGVGFVILAAAFMLYIKDRK